MSDLLNLLLIVEENCGPESNDAAENRQLFRTVNGILMMFVAQYHREMRTKETTEFCFGSSLLLFVLFFMGGFGSLIMGIHESFVTPGFFPATGTALIVNVSDYKAIYNRLGRVYREGDYVNLSEFGYDGYYNGTIVAEGLPAHYIGGTICYMMKGKLDHLLHDFDPGHTYRIAVSNSNKHDCHSIDRISGFFIAGVVMLACCACYIFCLVGYCCNEQRKRRRAA